jgi:hypothetical protein
VSKCIASDAERLDHVTRRQLVDPAVHSCEGCFGKFSKLGMAVFVAHQHPKSHQAEQHGTGNNADRERPLADAAEDRLFLWL